MALFLGLASLTPAATAIAAAPKEDPRLVRQRSCEGDLMALSNLSSPPQVFLLLRDPPRLAFIADEEKAFTLRGGGAEELYQLTRTDGWNPVIDQGLTIDGSTARSWPALTQLETMVYEAVDAAYKEALPQNLLHTVTRIEKELSPQRTSFAFILEGNRVVAGVRLFNASDYSVGDGATSMPLERYLDISNIPTTDALQRRLEDAQGDRPITEGYHGPQIFEIGKFFIEGRGAIRRQRRAILYSAVLWMTWASFTHAHLFVHAGSPILSRHYKLLGFESVFDAGPHSVLYSSSTNLAARLQPTINRILDRD